MEGMQFLTINPDPDKNKIVPEPDDQQPGPGIEPLDVSNLAALWPRWCDTFKVYVATNYNNHLDNGELFAIFLKCLGPEGAALVTSLYPPKDADSAQDSDAFDEVWWRVTKLCNEAHDSELDRWGTSLIPYGRRHLRESSAQDIEKDQDKWIQLIPQLSLCELEHMSRAVPRLEQVLRNYSKLFGVKIEKCCLEKYSLDSDQEVFLKYATISSVTLRDLCEMDARGVWTLFGSNIKRLSLHNIVIIEDIAGFPDQLTELTLIDCKIEKNLMEKWMSLTKSTLKRFYRDNFQDMLNLEAEQCSYYGHFSGSIKGRKLNFNQSGESSLQFRSFFNDDYLNSFFGLTHVYINLDINSQIRAEDLKFDRANLTFLATKNWIPLEFLQELTSLQYLWIMCPVDPTYKDEIDQLKIKTVIVHYEDVPEPNLIFEMLNEYCLLEITKYLSTSEWMALGQMHWIMEMALVSYKYTRVYLTDEHIRNSGISPDSEHFNYVAQFVKKCNITDKYCLTKFTSLKSFVSTANMECDVFDALPDDLDTLAFINCADNVDLQPRFRKLNPKLNVLVMTRSAGLKCLSELYNLRELTISNKIPIDEFMLLLKQNSKLQRIRIFIVDSNGWFISEDILNHIETLKELKDLAYFDNVCLSYFIPNHINQRRFVLAHLLQRFGSQITRLAVFDYSLGPEMNSLPNRGCLTKIKEFHCKESRPEDPFDEKDLQKLLSIIFLMKSLEKLQIDLIGRVTYWEPPPLDSYQVFCNNVWKDSDLMLLIKSLPCLVVLILPRSVFEYDYEYTIRFEMELREYLKTNNRHLRINKTNFP